MTSHHTHCPPAAHPTVVSLSSSAYHKVVDSRVATYFSNNPQHAIIALFFVVRTIILPALIKKKPLPIALPEDSEEMVDFGLGSAPTGIKGENGEVEVQWGKEKSVKSPATASRREGLRQRN